MSANGNIDDRIARLETIGLAWDRVERALFHRNPSKYYRALCDVYEAHGTPFGEFEMGLQIWIRFNQSTTVN